MKVSIIIPTFNGIELLKKHLPTLLSADGFGDCDLIIADDGSRDGTEEWVSAYCPSSIVIRNRKNQGFSKICNLAISQSTGDVVILLNNDVSVEKGFLTPLLDALFSRDEIFAVNSRIIVPNHDMLDEGMKLGWRHNGLVYVDCYQPKVTEQKRQRTLYATACAAAYRRDRLENLGGFDEIYSPCYWEDVDLSYRALRRGWEILYEPASVVYHQHETTTSRLNPQFLAKIRYRNQLLFTWNNITDMPWSIETAVKTSASVVYRCLRDRDMIPASGYIAALARLPEVLSRRAIAVRESVVSDRKIFKEYGNISNQGELEYDCKHTVSAASTQ